MSETVQSDFHWTHLKSVTYEEWAEALSSRFTHGNTGEKVVDDTRIEGTFQLIFALQ
jgi:hypothetical protein